MTAPGWAEDAYKTTKEIVAETKSIKVGPQEFTFYLRRGVGVWHLQAAIGTKENAPIFYEQVTLRAYDDRRKELSLRLMMPHVKTYIISSTNTLWGGRAFGDYLFNMGKKRRLASVQVIRGGEKHTFVFPKTE